MAENEYYNRYTGLIKDGEYRTLPLITISTKQTDFYETYISNRTRLDVLSEKYYDVPYYTWLILSANPIWGGLEFGIKNGAQLRIPYPLDPTLKEYNDKLRQHIQLYGL